MKVKISLSIEMLKALSVAIEEIYLVRPTQDKMDKVYRSIGFILAPKIEKHYKAAKKKFSDLFENSKKVNITFEYFEAWALIEILRDLVPHCTEVTAKHHLLAIIADLDQKTV